MEFASPAQCAGYVAFVLGVTAFVQKSDRRLKVFNASEGFVYSLHFLLLGNLAASASAAISGTRSLLALKSRSMPLAVVIVAVNLAFGVALAGTGPGWLPVMASCIATVALFSMQGVALRMVLLSCTLLWLVNNIISRSIGGTLLEITIAVINVSTILRMLPSQAAFAKVEITEPPE